MSTQDKSAELPVVAWRYEDSRGHYRYRGPAVDFDKKYAILKPIALTDHAQATARIQELQAGHDEALRLRDVNEKVATEWRDAAKDLSNQVQELQAQVAEEREQVEELREALASWEGEPCSGDCISDPCDLCDGTRRTPGKGEQLEQTVADMRERAEAAEAQVAALSQAAAQTLDAVNAYRRTTVEITDEVVCEAAEEALSVAGARLRALVDSATGAHQTQGGA